MNESGIVPRQEMRGKNPSQGETQGCSQLYEKKSNKSCQVKSHLKMTFSEIIEDREEDLVFGF
jgi:hypothetical protein